MVSISLQHPFHKDWLQASIEKHDRSSRDAHLLQERLDEYHEAVGTRYHHLACIANRTNKEGGNRERVFLHEQRALMRDLRQLHSKVDERPSKHEPFSAEADSTPEETHYTVRSRERHLPVSTSWQLSKGSLCQRVTHDNEKKTSSTARCR